MFLVYKISIGNQLLTELSDKHQQEMADIQQLLDDEKKNVVQLEETIETKIAQVRNKYLCFFL